MLARYLEGNASARPAACSAAKAEEACCGLVRTVQWSYGVWRGPGSFQCAERVSAKGMLPRSALCDEACRQSFNGTPPVRMVDAAAIGASMQRCEALQAAERAGAPFPAANLTSR